MRLRHSIAGMRLLKSSFGLAGARKVCVAVAPAVLRSVVCVLGADTQLGGQLCRELLAGGHNVKAAVNYIDNARTLDFLMDLKDNYCTSKVPDARPTLDIYEVNPHHDKDRSYLTVVRGCDFVYCIALPVYIRTIERTRKLGDGVETEAEGRSREAMAGLLHSIAGSQTVKRLIICHKVEVSEIHDEADSDSGSGSRSSSTSVLVPDVVIGQNMMQTAHEFIASHSHNSNFDMVTVVHGVLLPDNDGDTKPPPSSDKVGEKERLCKTSTPLTRNNYSSRYLSNVRDVVRTCLEALRFNAEDVDKCSRYEYNDCDLSSNKDAGTHPSIMASRYFRYDCYHHQVDETV